MLFSIDVVKEMKKVWNAYKDELVLNTAHLSTEQMFTSLGGNTILTRRTENHIVKLVEKCLKGMAPSYFSKYFHIIFMIMTLGIRPN